MNSEKAIKVILTAIFGGKYTNIEKLLTERKTISEIEEVLFNSLMKSFDKVIPENKGDKEITIKQIQHRLRLPDKRREIINILNVETKGTTDLDIFLLQRKQTEAFANNLKNLVEDVDVEENLLIEIINETLESFSFSLWDKLSVEQISHLDYLKSEEQHKTLLNKLDNIPTYDGIVTLLNDWEKIRQKETESLLKIEQKLKTKNLSLYISYNNSKQLVLNLIYQKFHRFERYTGYSRHHIRETLSLLSDILEDSLDEFYSEVLYVMCLSVYLEYLGICQDKIPSNNQDYAQLAIQYLHKNYRDLKISEDYLKVFTTIVEGLSKTDISALSKEVRINRRQKVKVKFIISCIKLAKKLDIVNITSNFSLYNDTLPHILESRKLWEQMDKTTLLSIQNEIIIIESNCNEQNIYNALNKWVLEVEELIKNSINTLLSVEDDTFPIKHINNKIRSETLPNKTNIGVSIHRNLIKAFIEQVYETPTNKNVKNRPNNKFIAIREAVQNAIDACNFKKINNGQNYKPEITISLDDEFLVIEDNGIGMNLFVVENYFAKLGHSYYEHHLSSKHNDIIAQFGVGVFSYLGIADYIDVSTHKANQKPLKFRIDRDANTNFYFYDATSHKKGTTIKLKLKEEIKDELTPEVLIQILKFYFRFVDVDIFVETLGDKVLLEKDSFNVDIQKVVSSQVKIEYQDTFKYVPYSITQETENYKANLGIILLNNHQNVLKFNQSLSTLSTNPGQDFMTEISHKGVFIKKRPGSFFGKINIKATQKLNYARNVFIDQEYIQNIFNELGLKLIEKLFGGIQNAPQKLAKYTHYVILNIFKGGNFTDDHLMFFQKRFYCEVFEGDYYNYCSIDNLVSSDAFNIISIPIKKYSSLDDKNLYLKSVFEKENNPILVTTRNNFHFFYEFMIGKGFDIKISNNDYVSYLLVNPSRKIDYKKIYSYHIFPFIDDTLVTVFLNQNFSAFTFFNSHHRIIKHYQNLVEHKQDLTIMSSFFNAFSQFGINFLFNRGRIPELIDSLLFNLNHILGHLKNPDLLLQKEDFPKWMYQI